MADENGLRERKKQQTRTELVRSGLTLMARDGYEAVTAVAIAEAAGVSRATFFNYFTSKEQLVLATDSTLRRTLLAETLAQRDPETPPRVALLAAVRSMLQHPGWPLAPDDDLVAIRVQLLTDVRSLRTAFLGELADLQQEWTELLIAEYPDLSRTEAAALVGALVGAISTAVLSHLSHNGRAGDIPAIVEEAAGIALDNS